MQSAMQSAGYMQSTGKPTEIRQYPRAVMGLEEVMKLHEVALTQLENRLEAALGPSPPTSGGSDRSGPSIGMSPVGIVTPVQELTKRLEAATAHVNILMDRLEL